MTGFILPISNEQVLKVFPVCYSNADTEKESILNDNKAKAGIYCWINIDSKKKYVGSSIDLYRRFLQYYNIKYITRAAESSLICRALLKHGYSRFRLEILEYCDPNNLIEREQYYIDHLNPEYNILKVAGSLFGFKHSPETLKKMKEIISNRSDEEKANISAKLREAALGRTYKHTEETKIKLKNAMLGRKHSEKSKEKMRIFQSNRTKHSIPGVKIEVKDMETGQTFLYDSLRIAGKELNSSHAALLYNLNKGKELFRGRYRITKIMT